MAFLIVHQSWSPPLELLWLIVASACFYSAGMVLNDVFDVEIDSKERPERPIPSQSIRLATARNAGFGLLALGIALCSVAGIFASGDVAFLPMLQQPLPRCVLLGTLLMISILLYDGPLKRTIFAPAIMGLCRTLNILLGASTFVAEVGMGNLDPILGLPWTVWWIAISVGLLITGTTLLGRNEAKEEQYRQPLVMAALVIAVGLVGLATIFLCPPASTGLVDVDHQADPSQRGRYLIFLGIVSISLFRRVIEAVVVAKPKAIQTGVVAVLRSLILLDGAVCYFFAAGQFVYPLTVAALLIPALVIGRYIRST